MSYRDVYLRSTSISRENIDNVLYIELVLKSDTVTTETYRKRATGDKDILGIRKQTQPRFLSLLSLAISKNIFVSVTHRGILFWICISHVGLHYDIRRG